MIEIIQGDAVSDAGAVIVAIDCAQRGMEGNISRAYTRRWSDARMEIEDEIRYPIGLGRTVPTHPENESGVPLVGMLLRSLPSAPWTNSGRPQSFVRRSPKRSNSQFVTASADSLRRQ